MPSINGISYLASRSSRTIDLCVDTYNAATSDQACNEQSPIPTFHERDVAENQGTSDPLLWISTYCRKKDPTPEIIQFTFDELESFCRDPEILGTGDRHQFSSSAPLKPQCNATLDVSCSFLAYEFDHMPADISSNDLVACISEYRSFCYSTSNHRSFANGGYFCVVVELSEPVDGDNLRFVSHKFAEHFGELSEYIDDSSLSPTHKFGFPITRKNQCNFEFTGNLGQPLDVYEFFVEAGCGQ